MGFRCRQISFCKFYDSCTFITEALVVRHTVIHLQVTVIDTDQNGVFFRGGGGQKMEEKGNKCKFFSFLDFRVYKF